MDAIKKIKAAMKATPNIAGIHMEGPYINPRYGAKKVEQVTVNRSEYLEIAKSGVIKQWTFAPEVEGTSWFLNDISEFGIVPAIGNSNASDNGALLCDNFFYEIICDDMGVHVRPVMMRLAVKTVGLDKIVGITDACTGSEDESDVNILDGVLMGSKLTMQRVARNFLCLGYSIPEVMRITSYNPACAILADKTIGSIEIGKKADLIAFDDGFENISLAGN